MDCRSQQAGVSSEEDGCTGEKCFQQACSTGKLVDEDYATFVDMTAAEITNEVKAELTDFVSDFRDVLALTDLELVAKNQVYHHIDVGETAPIRLLPHWVPPAKLPSAQSEVQDMLRRGMTQHPQNTYSAPIVMVPRKDASNRFCVDYRYLNEVTKEDAQSISKIDQTLDALKGAQWFSILDLTSGYWQVEVAPKERQKIAFVTLDRGLHEYKRMLFRLSIAPGTFQRLIIELFKTELFIYVPIFLDDILNYSKALEEHADHIRRVFVTLHAANLRPKPKKIKVFQSQTDYSGYKERQSTRH